MVSSSFSLPAFLQGHFLQQKSPYQLDALVDLTQPSFWIAAASICFNPLYWNIVAQNEYNNKTITKLLGGRRYLGCYLLGASIFLLGILRDHLYNAALVTQPAHPYLLTPLAKYLGAALFVAGQVFVLSSMWALGITGTYLGDYFGILMDSMVTGFPFNVMGDPMYWGSSMCFAGVALWFAKPAGLILTVLVVIVYTVALRFEGPFTANIYAKAAQDKKRGRSSQAPASSAAAKALEDTDGPARGTRSSAVNSRNSSPAPRSRATRSSSRKAK